MVHTPTYVFTATTLAQSAQVNTNFSELDLFFLSLGGGTVIGNVLFEDGSSNVTVSIDALIGQVSMNQLLLTPMQNSFFLQIWVRL